MKTSKLGLSPQKEYLVDFLRDFRWHCASEWASRVKDDRTRFCELEPYMAQRGYKIASEPCRGEICGRHSCPLNKRRAEKLPTHLQCESCIEATAALKAWV